MAFFTRGVTKNPTVSGTVATTTKTPGVFTTAFSKNDTNIVRLTKNPDKSGITLIPVKN